MNATTPATRRSTCVALARNHQAARGVAAAVVAVEQRQRGECGARPQQRRTPHRRQSRARRHHTAARAALFATTTTTITIVTAVFVGVGRRGDADAAIDGDDERAQRRQRLARRDDVAASRKRRRRRRQRGGLAEPTVGVERRRVSPAELRDTDSRSIRRATAAAAAR